MLYLKLFHGRKLGEELDDWGADGPIFGPLSYVHTTYGYHVKLGEPESPYDNLGDLYVVDDLLYYDGMYYGDWSVFDQSDLLDDDKKKITKYQERKAEPPGTTQVDGWRSIPKETAPKLTHANSKAIQEVLRRYIGEELKPQMQFTEEQEWNYPEEIDERRAALTKDIDYIEGLARLLD